MSQPGKPTVTFFLGGARSGKSRLALHHAASNYDRPLYLATCEPGDPEMRARVRRHQEERGARWQTVEEPLSVESVLLDPDLDADVVLLDCLTLWLTNVMLKLGAEQFEPRRDSLLAALRQPARPVVMVSNEVGMGIVPDSPLGREFRDLAGWLNQEVAKVADHVLFVVAGLPLVLKGSYSEVAE